MFWITEDKFRFLDKKGFEEVQRAYQEVRKKHRDIIAPRQASDIREIDGENCITHVVEYICGEGKYWAQHFSLDHYRRERDGKYQCRFSTIASTHGDLRKGQERLEEALLIADKRTEARLQQSTEPNAAILSR